MSLQLVTPATQKPLSRDEVKLHLKEDDTDQDAMIDMMAESARLHLEGRDGWLGRALLTQTWRWRLDQFPRTNRHSANIYRSPIGVSDPLRVPLAPLQSVTSIQYIDTAGVLQTWPTASYIVDTNEQPGRITPAFGEFWPLTQHRIDAVTIEFVCGYGTTPDSIPEPIRSALLLIIGDLFKNRETRLRAGQVDNPTAAALLMPYKMAAF